jgi:hypothetical protein
VLYAGVPESAAIVGVDVTGFAWHDSSANALSYTTFGDDELFLWVARDNAAPELVTQAVGIDGRMTAWGDWGFAVQDEARESIVLLTETGEIKDFHPGRVLASHESGWLVIEDDGLSLLSSGGGVRGLAGPETAEGLLGARFSPDRSLLAITTSDGLGVIAIDGGDELFRTDVRPGVVADVIWSSDGRFVAYPGVRGLVFVDVSTGETEEVLGSYTFTGIGVLPLSGA